MISSGWFDFFSATAVHLFKVCSVLIVLQAKRMSVPGQGNSLNQEKLCV